MIPPLSTPIVFIIFNRPLYTKRVWETIRQAQPKQLFVIADGPRTPEEAIVCSEVRAITEHIDWQCEVTRIYAEENLGTRKRISSGITEVFTKVEQAIILEDDCLPDPSFFPYSEKLLAQYQNDESVLMITGGNYVASVPIENPYSFSRYFAIWGWATWRRAWAHYDDTMEDWPRLRKESWLKQCYPGRSRRGLRTYLKSMFDQAYYKNLNSWGARWLYSCLRQNGVCIFPQVNLISNIGIDGVHSSGANNNLPTFSLGTERLVKQPIEICTVYDDAFFKGFKTNFSIRGLILKFLAKIKGMLRNIGIVAPKPAIFVRLEGGLGNIMFQYATGRHLAYKNGVSMKYDVHSYKTNPLGDYSFSLETFNIEIKNKLITPGELRWFKKFKYRFGRHWFWYNRLITNRNIYVQRPFPFSPDILALKPPLYLEGWWQTEKYFADIREILLRDFKVRTPLSGRNKEYAEEMSRTNSVGVHIRRCDYVTNTKTKTYHGELPKKYYKEAVEYIARVVKDPTLFIFSDDIEWTKKNMSFPFPTVYIEGNRDLPHEDVRLMSLCKHNIVANSTLGWWGAWLNNYKERIIVAPDKWFANAPKIDARDLVPDSWVKIPSYFQD